MTKKDSLKAEIDLLKIVINTLFGFMLAVVLYNIQVYGKIFSIALISIAIMGIVGFALRIRHVKLRNKLEELPETLNLKLDVNMNEKGNIVINQEKLSEQSQSLRDFERKNLDEFKKGFLIAANNRNLTFFDNIKADIDLRITKKLAEIEISKKELGISMGLVYAGIILALGGIGVSEILFILPTFIQLEKWSWYYLFGGIIIAFSGVILVCIYNLIIKKDLDYIEFLYDRILEIDRRLP